MGDLWRKISEVCCRKKPRPDNRTVYVGNEPPPGVDVMYSQPFMSNIVISSKYTILTFLPKNLFEQFQRIANFYFLCVGLIELTIDSPVSPITSFLPLVFVISTTAIKQGYEDWLRHVADKEVNNCPTRVVRKGKTEIIKSKDIVVGDIVQVSSNEAIPCDIVMLSSADSSGECLITTANLDGETNLKVFNSLTETRHLMDENSFKEFRASIDCEQPHTDLYKFVGNINLYETDSAQSTARSLDTPNVLLRGSRLKNTPYVYGCAIYTGQETKISLNSKYSSTKFSRVERAMNKCLIVFLVGLVLFSVTMTMLKRLYFYAKEENSHKNMWYAEGQDEASFKVIIEELLAFMVLVNYVIPISMYVTIEFQKFFGSMFFQWDIEMFDVQINEPAKANTSDLNEELGQVEYLFTDKTGTLTENNMQFKQCSVGGVKYIEISDKLCQLVDIPDCQPTPLEEYTDGLKSLFRVLALCHTVHVEHIDGLGPADYSQSGFEYEYQASSPDEKALVEACRRYGVVYHGNRKDKAEVSFNGRLYQYTVHHILDFDPTRKRMSVIVEDEEGRYILLCKGAEMAMFHRISNGDKATTSKHVDEYALLGLRTLVLGHKIMSKEEYEKVNKLLVDAKTSLENRKEKLTKAFEEVEDDMQLVGATAVEDKLQEGVPDTIEALRMAGIKVWVLTGDKEETAVNISHSAGHFSREMVELRLTKITEVGPCEDVIDELYRIVETAKGIGEHKHALIMDGKSLEIAVTYYEDKLRQLCENVTTVLCCRMSPLQKAQVVKLMKNSASNPTTAAIGDGANDVSMIQEAHVGIGIMGKEGRQAVRSSDYAFGRFKFLKRAILVHGHYFYIRIAMLVQYFFYKNVAFIFAQMYFTFFSAYTAQSVYESFFLLIYNITTTSLPILIYGLFEQNIPQQILLKHPQAYREIRRNAALSFQEFLKWNTIGLWHSIVCFFGPYLMYEAGIHAQEDGKMFGVYDFGAVIYTAVVFIANITLMLETYHFSVMTLLAYLITFVGFFAMTIMYNAFLWSAFTYDFSIYGSLYNVWGVISFWMLLLLLIVMALIPNIIFRAWRDIFHPLRGRKPQLKSYTKFYDEEDIPIALQHSKYGSQEQCWIISYKPNNNEINMEQLQTNTSHF